MLAALVTPVLLYAGLAAVGVPVLIHLLNRRRFHRVRWSATQFLLEAQRRNRRRVRMEELILLALRCLAVFLVGAMLARWFSSSSTLWAMVGAGARTERIILLDDSYSMTRMGPTGSNGQTTKLFDQALAAVEELVRTLRQQAPGDSLTILLTSRPDSPIRSDPTLDSLDPQSLAADLQTRMASYRPARIPAAMEAIRRLLDARSATPSACLYVVSDFQRVDWSPHEVASQEGASQGLPPLGLRTAGGPHGPASILADWADKNHSLKVVLIDVGSPVRSNLSITAIEPRQPQPVAGIETGYDVRVANFGSEESQATNLQTYVGDAAQPPTPMPAIAPGQTVEVRLDATFPGPGSEGLAIELPPDALAPDNSRWQAVNVARHLRVLLVDGEKSADPYQDEVFLLTVALRPEGPQFSGNEVTVIDEAELETMNLAEFHVVMLANVYRITDSVAERLTRYAAEGGGVVFFLGDQVDPEVYNRLLYRDGQGLLPARLGAVVSAPADQPGVPIHITATTHPLVRQLAAGGPALLADARVWQYVRCEMPTDTQPADVGSASTNVGPASSRSSEDRLEAGPTLLVGLEDADHSPLLLARGFGKGHVVLLTSSADKEWNNLADSAAYVVWMMELVQSIARRAEQPRDFLVGEPIRWVLDLGRFKPGASLRPPTYPADPAVDLQPQPDPQSGQMRLDWSNTDQPGIYRLEMADVNGQLVTETLAVNVDPAESDLTLMDRAALLGAWGEVPAEYVTASELTGLRDEQHRREMWPALFVLLVCVLMAEQSLAWYFGAGRRWSLLWRRTG